MENDPLGVGGLISGKEFDDVTSAFVSAVQFISKFDTSDKNRLPSKEDAHTALSLFWANFYSVHLLSTTCFSVMLQSSKKESFANAETFHRAYNVIYSKALKPLRSLVQFSENRLTA